MRRREKASIDDLIKRARDGNDVTCRAACATAYNVRIGRLVAGIEEEESEEAAAGALLAAYTAAEITGINKMIMSYVEAMNNAPRG